MKNELKLSIAIAYYNRKDLFLTTLESISKSKFANDIEIVVADDASDEEHRLEDIVDNYSFPINLIRIEPEDKWYVNPCVPFNKAIHATKAPLIMLQNPECYHNGDVIAAAIEHTKDNNYISFGCYSLDKESTVSLKENIKIVSRRKAQRGGETGWYNHSIINPRPYHFASCLTRKNMMALQGFNQKYANGIGFDDDEFLFRVGKQVRGNIQIVDAPNVFHQYHYDDKSFEYLYNSNPELLRKNQELFGRDKIIDFIV